MNTKPRRRKTARDAKGIMVAFAGSSWRTATDRDAVMEIYRKVVAIVRAETGIEGSGVSVRYGPRYRNMPPTYAPHTDSEYCANDYGDIYVGEQWLIDNTDYQRIVIEIALGGQP